MLLKLVRTAFTRAGSVTTPTQVRELIANRRLADAADAIERLHPQTPNRVLEQKCLRAEIAYRHQDDETARRLFGEVLVEEPGNAQAHYGLSLLLYEQGDADAALRHAQFANAAQPLDYRFIAQLGLCHVQLGNHPVAERLLRKALHGMPDDKSSWNNMGIVQAAKGDPAQARVCFLRALEIDPAFRNARDNLALLPPPADAGTMDGPALVVRASDTVSHLPWYEPWLEAVRLQKDGRGSEAIGIAEHLLAQWPDDGALAARIGQLYGATGDLQGGIDTVQAFLARHPDNTDALVGLARAHAATSAYQPAEDAVRKAMALGDTSSDTLLLAGEILHARERYAEAADFAERAQAATERHTVALLTQLGASQVMACRYDAALATYERLFAGTRLHDHPAVGGYAMCLTYMGRFEEARDILDKLLAFSPNDPGLRAQSFQLRLLHEDYRRGWEDYLYRGLSAGKSFRVLPFPCWKGEPLVGKRIVVLAEQGLGDQVMLASCLPDLLALGPEKVWLEAINRVAPTLARSFPECTVIPTRQDRDLDWVRQAAGADYYVPLGDLPHHFRNTRDAFPRKAFLKADPGRVAYWQRTIRACGPGPYIGVSWRGGTQVTRTSVRSFSAASLVPLADAQAATWINLQYGDVQSDLEQARAAGLQVHHWAQAIEDLDEFAALITALDGVVTVCNTTVHYAGALGKKVLVMAPHVPEWRYGLQFDHMPWYPDVRVLRQPAHGDWNAVLTKVAELLPEWLSSRTKLSS